MTLEEFESFLGVKHPGAKRFGLDGAETLAPLLEQVIKRGGSQGVEDIVIGMPHRGRLNVLANVMGKPLEAIFHEFGGAAPLPDGVEGSGDVKYHLGASSDRSFGSGNAVHLSLLANPSHLEAVDPVVLGQARARQDRKGDGTRSRALPLLIHGDAAFAGQGVVAECFGLSGLKGHRAGGLVACDCEQSDRVYDGAALWSVVAVSDGCWRRWWRRRYFTPTEMIRRRRCMRRVWRRIFGSGLVVRRWWICFVIGVLVTTREMSRRLRSRACMRGYGSTRACRRFTSVVLRERAW